MAGTGVPAELVEQVARFTPLTPAAAGRVVTEVVYFFSETVEQFVRRRHRELQAAGRSNAQIFEQVAEELGEWRFVAPSVSQRQLRRIIYG
jgi:hypothetical protein